jgi:hypothetical protein
MERHGEDRVTGADGRPSSYTNKTETTIIESSS